MPDESQTQTDQPTEQTETEDVAGLKSALEKEREARRGAERTAKALEGRLKTIEDSGKSEAEKTKQRLDELERANADKDKAIRERDAKDASRDAARKAGSPDPDLVYRVIRTDLEYDADGKATNVKTLIDDLKATSPHLFRAPGGKADAGAGKSGQPTETKDWIRNGLSRPRS